MKKLTISFILLFLLFTNILFSQNYFGNVTEVPLNNNEIITIYGNTFDLENINNSTGLLDIALMQNNPLGNEMGQWNPNNGNGSFGQFNNISPSTNSGMVLSNMFIKLNPNSPLKDFVVGRGDGLEVHLNQHGISGASETISIPGYYFNFCGSGLFDQYNFLEDVISCDGSSTIHYFVNNNNGGFLYNNNYTITFSSNVSYFKLRQLNDREIGYIPDNFWDRWDIMFISSRPSNTIYTYLNNNNNGFAETPYAVITPPILDSDNTVISDFEAADLRGTGYNDIILVGHNPNVCPYKLYAWAYENVQGQFINTSTPLWTFDSYNLYPINYVVSCHTEPQVVIADINNDGFNDIILVSGVNEYPGIRVDVFINQHSKPGLPLFPSSPTSTFIYPINSTINPQIGKVIAADIYGSQQQQGGGIALLVSYILQETGYYEQHVIVINSTSPQTNPPPPICQGCIIQSTNSSNCWNPHLHLDNRGERDFRYYQIFKWKYGDQGYTIIEDNYVDTGYTDVNEYVDPYGQDRPAYNCCYYATEVDYAHNVSLPSQTACYQVDCTPINICNNCPGGDNLLLNQAKDKQKLTAKLPEKFSVSNYPNPFNPTTKISYALPKPTKVVIIVYDILGRLVKELINENKDAGFYNVSFDGTNLASGIYFYKIQAIELKGRNYIQTGRMLLLK